ncbi:acyltransferase family protein [Paraburkholderia tropica]|uniref:Peptidoglycan/LPS O-acetylase OafA/YrhL, contains acyltransferase and SGNH-hydrolase domains n=1 Tax=Paraburkholderia tropica TaxID=92647 RepID=A0AAQ1GDH8_9BURK|nr:acyltransferase [Paraburkholderia tropica]RQN40416.1 acyltransferase [Paraburkholderia tropica]SEJ36474.1 Peptidoglycan/LPS O-acetylase OafA/YrhL, contains acyltransferase and SGNH-hydrolase domains [Paraburkholderia tropica]
MSDPALETVLPPASAMPAAARPAAAVVAGDHLIDALRGFAALLVAYFHCRQVTWIGMGAFHQTHASLASPGTIAAWLTLPVAWGSAGVPIFFVISGYCIHRSGAARLLANPGFQLDAKQFWLRRFVRIYPVLLAALALTFVADSISLTMTPVSHKILDIGPQAFLVNLFSLQGVAGKTYGSNGALWTLSLEVQFYLLYPLLFAARRRFGFNAVLAAVAAINVMSALTLAPHDIVFFTSYWFSWMLGAWIAEARLRGSEGFRFAWPAAAVFAVAGCAAFHFGQYGAFQLWACAFACYLVKALARPLASGGVLLPLFSKLGEFSYSLYLIHLPLFVLLGSLLFRSELQTSIWPSFGFTLAVLPVAWVFYRLFERPALNVAARLRKRAV